MIALHLPPVFRLFNFTKSIGIFLVCFAAITVHCLQITKFEVPISSKTDEDHQLICEYQLNSTESLYFLRWYKDGKEFFRYMPKEEPPIRVFDGSGVSVKTLFPNSTTVVLMKVNTSASGLYHCEVSAEAPNFETADKEANFTVIEDPIGQPFITESSSSVGTSINETIVATCTGPEGWPAPQLTWTLATTPIPTMDPTVITQWEHDGRHAGKKKTTSTLHLKPDYVNKFVNQLEKSRNLHDLMNGSFVVLQLRCTSRFLGLFEQSDEISIRIQRNLPATSIPVASGSSRDIVKSTKSSFTSTAVAGAKTNHGAFTNVAPSVFIGIFNRLIWTGFSLLLPSSWSIYRHWF